MNATPVSKSASKPGNHGLLTALICLVCVLGFVFKDSFNSEQVLFANDGPLGPLKSDALKMPGGFTGFWSDLNWVGTSGGSATVGVTYAVLWVLGPLAFAKFYVPLALIILGLSARL